MASVPSSNQCPAPTAEHRFGLDGPPMSTTPVSRTPVPPAASPVPVATSPVPMAAPPVAASPVPVSVPQAASPVPVAASGIMCRQAMAAPPGGSIGWPVALGSPTEPGGPVPIRFDNLSAVDLAKLMNDKNRGLASPQ